MSILIDDKFKQTTIHLLRTAPEGLQISFTKRDGSIRNMRCTLIQSKIPAEKIPKSETPSSTETVVRVFDLDKQDWRSFRWDSLRTTSPD